MTLKFASILGDSEGGFGLHLIDHDNGTFSFVGSVPYQLSHVTKAGNTVTSEEVCRQSRLPGSARTIKPRVFVSVHEARRAALLLGYAVTVDGDGDGDGGCDDGGAR